MRCYFSAASEGGSSTRVESEVGEGRGLSDEVASGDSINPEGPRGGLAGVGVNKVAAVGCTAVWLVVGGVANALVATVIVGDGDPTLGVGVAGGKACVGVV